MQIFNPIEYMREELDKIMRAENERLKQELEGKDLPVLPKPKRLSKRAMRKLLKRYKKGQING